MIGTRIGGPLIDTRDPTVIAARLSNSMKLASQASRQTNAASSSDEMPPGDDAAYAWPWFESDEPALETG